MAKIDKVQEVAIDKLVPYERNAKIHSDEQVRKIADSITEFGFLSPCIIDKDYNVIAGHGRIEASKLLGLEKVPCLFVDGLTEEQRRAYILADNKLTELGEWDMDLVYSELEDLQSMDFNIELTGFELPEIELAEVEEDDFEAEPPKEPRIHKGEVWQLGSHRLMCGDSTILSDVEKLLGGAQVDLLLTDPPYNVDYTGKTSEELKIDNDAMDDDEFREFLMDAFTNACIYMKDGASFYVWYASREVVNFQTALIDSGLTVKQELIWNKSSMVMGRQDYQWKHEPCLYGWKEGASHLWNSDRKQTTIIDCDRPSKNLLHPTMKPVRLFDYLIKNSTKQEMKVLDLFGGSGTTIIACEQNNRIAYLMEYDEGYADVIIQRWEQLTGQKAVLADG